MKEELLDNIVPSIRTRDYVMSLHYWENLVRDSSRPIPSSLLASVGNDTPEIIEHYPEDARGASCLVLGFDGTGQEIHTIIGYERNPIQIITAYKPTPKEWINGRTRRKQ
jgi:hypothetical protein